MSTDVDALVAFLKARLAEDEQAARAWPGDQVSWQVVGQREARYDNGAAEGFSAIDVSGQPADWWERIRVLRDPGGLAAHIVRHDPARVLADIAADRELLDRYEQLLRSQRDQDAVAAELKADIARRERTGGWAGAGSLDVRLAALRREKDYLNALRPVLERWVKAKAARHADHEDYRLEWRP